MIANEKDVIESVYQNIKKIVKDEIEKEIQIKLKDFEYALRERAADIENKIISNITVSVSNHFLDSQIYTFEVVIKHRFKE